MTDPINPGFLDECEREALHHIGAIQPNGALLGGTAGDPTLRCVSENLAQWSGLDPAAVLGRPVDVLVPWLSADKASELANAIIGMTKQTAAKESAGTDVREGRLLLRELCGGPQGPLDALLTRDDRQWLLELQPALRQALQRQAQKPVPHALYRMPHTGEEWQGLCDFLSQQLREATGCERVMVYRFGEDGSGEVIAEDLADGLPPYLGLRYPASDIPRIARTLYLRNRHRQIPDAGAYAVPLRCTGDMAPDLTLSDLRAVSPVHVQYLHNMGVTASLSFSVVLNGELWGLIACHHSTPLALPLPLRERCADMVHAFTLGVAGFRTSRRLAILGHSDREISLLIDGIGTLEPGKRTSHRLHRALLDLVGASGAALAECDASGRASELLLTFGKTPGPAQIRSQLGWLHESAVEPVFATDRLPGLFPPAAAYAALASGLLAVRVGRFTDGVGRERVFLWWRPEQAQTVRWAGDPRKSAMFSTQSTTLSPRSSFTAWVETTSGQSEPWGDLDLLNAKKFRSRVLRDINADLLRD